MDKRLIFAISVGLNVALIGFGLLYIFQTRASFNNTLDEFDDRVVVVEDKMENLKKEVESKVQLDETINSETKELKDKVGAMKNQQDILQSNYNKLRIYKEKLEQVFQIQ